MKMDESNKALGALLETQVRTNLGARITVYEVIRVPGVLRHEKAARFNGIVSKCLALPVEALMDERPEDEPLS